MHAAWVRWSRGTAGNTTPLGAVPQERWEERHGDAEERGERGMREKERKEER